MARASFGWQVSLLCIVVVSAWTAGSSLGHGETVRMKNGMVLEGNIAPLLSIGGDPLNPTSDVQRIVLVDNQLTRTFVGRNQVDKIDTPPPTSIERFKVDQKVATAGRPIGSVGS